MADIKQNIDIKVNTDTSSLNQLDSEFNKVFQDLLKIKHGINNATSVEGINKLKAEFKNLITTSGETIQKLSNSSHSMQLGELINTISKDLDSGSQRIKHNLENMYEMFKEAADSINNIKITPYKGYDDAVSTVNALSELGKKLGEALGSGAMKDPTGKIGETLGAAIAPMKELGATIDNYKKNTLEVEQLTSSLGALKDILSNLNDPFKQLDPNKFSEYAKQYNDIMSQLLESSKRFSDIGKLTDSKAGEAFITELSNMTKESETFKTKLDELGTKYERFIDIQKNAAEVSKGSMLGKLDHTMWDSNVAKENIERAEAQNKILGELDRQALRTASSFSKIDLSKITTMDLSRLDTDKLGRLETAALQASHRLEELKERYTQLGSVKGFSNSAEKGLDTVNTKLQNIDALLNKIKTAKSIDNTMIVNKNSDSLKGYQDLLSFIEKSDRRAELNRTVQSFGQLNKAIETLNKASRIDWNKIVGKVPKEDLEAAKKQLLEAEQVIESIGPKASMSGEQLDKMSNTVTEITRLIDDALGGKGAGVQNSAHSIQEYASTLGILPGSFKKVMAVAGEFGPVIAAVGAAVAVGKKLWDMYIDSLKDATRYVTEAAKATGRFLTNLASGAITSFVDALKSIPGIFADIYSSVEKTVAKLKEFSELGVELGTNYFRIYKYLGATEGSKLVEFAQGLSQTANVDLTQVTNGLKGILAVTTQLGLESAEGVQKYTKGLMAMALDVSKFYGYSLEETMTQLESALNMGVLNSRSALARAMDLTDEDLDAFKKLDTRLERTNFLMQHGAKIAGTYSQWMKTPAGILAQLDGALKNLNNTIGQIATRLLAIVAPVLTQIINLANYALQVLAKVLGIDLSTAPGGFSSPDLSNAADEAGRYKDNLGKAKKAQDDLGKSSEKNEKKVASFDDVIQINESKSSSSGGAADDIGDLNDELGDLGKFDIGKWGSDFANGFKLPELSIDALKAKIKELLDQFKKLAKGINWSSILDGATKLGKDLADILNVIVDDEEAFRELGSIIGNTLNAGLTMLDTFLKNFHFKQFGTDIGAMIVTALDDLDETLAGHTIADFLIGMLNMGIGIFNEQPLTALTDSLTRIINTAINDLSSNEGLATITGFINSFFLDLTTSITTGIDNLEQNDTGGKIATIFYNMFNSLGQNMPAIITSCTRLITWLFDTLGTTIAESINGFFTGWFGDDPEEAVDNIISSLENIITTFFQNINKIGAAIQKHLPEILATITGVIDMISNDAEYWGEQAKPLVDSIIQIINAIDVDKLVAAFQKFAETSGLFDLIAKVGDKLFQLAVAKVLVGLQIFLHTKIGKLITWVIWHTINPGFAFLLDILEGFGIDAKKIVSDFVNKILEWFRKLGEGISNAGKGIKKLWDSIKDAGAPSWFGGSSTKNVNVNVHKSGFNNVTDDMTDYKSVKLNTNIRKAATGGLVTSSTILNVGEAGTEAIIPLERNTAWMDMLASRINAGRSNGGNININVPGKALYTRADLLEIADMVNKAQMAYSN